MAMNAAISRRLASLHHVLVVAADADPDAAALLATTDDQRTDGARQVMGRIADLGGLRPGLEPEQAAAIADVLIDPMPTGAWSDSEAGPSRHTSSTCSTSPPHRCCPKSRSPNDHDGGEDTASAQPKPRQHPVSSAVST